jgi:hypothetical protein
MYTSTDENFARTHSIDSIVVGQRSRSKWRRVTSVRALSLSCYFVQGVSVTCYGSCTERALKQNIVDRTPTGVQLEASASYHLVPFLMGNGKRIRRKGTESCVATNQSAECAVLTHVARQANAHGNASLNRYPAM